MARNSESPNREILQAALEGLEAQRRRIDEQIAQVRSLLGTRPVGRPPANKQESGRKVTKKAAASSSTKQNQKRTLSPEARKRIAAAQKKRWATFRKNQG